MVAIAFLEINPVHDGHLRLHGDQLSLAKALNLYESMIAKKK